MKNVRTLAVALSFVMAPCVAFAQDPPQDPPAGGGRGGRPTEPEIRPYERVITKDAKSDDGIFTVHRIKDRVLYEIPKDKLGREFLWVSQIAKTTLGAGYGGQAAGNRVVKWERRGDRILLRAVSYDVVADPKAPIARAVEAANNNPILMAFNVEAEGKDGTAGHRGHAAVHDRCDRVQRPDARRRADVRRLAVVRRPRRVVPREHRGGGDPHLQQSAGRGGSRRPRRATRARRPRRRPGAASRQPQRGDALQHGAAAGEADAAATVRRARRLLLHRARSTTARTSIALRSAASSPAGGWKRRIRTPRCRSQ